MQTANLWNQFHLYGRKTLAASFFLLLLGTPVFGQDSDRYKNLYLKKTEKDDRHVIINLPNYDKRKVHYGFLLGIHASNLSINYSNRFLKPSSAIPPDNSISKLASIQSRPSAGFSVGLIISLRVSQFWDLRLQPTFAFYNFYLDYILLEGAKIDSETEVVRFNSTQVLQPFFIEFPLLMKYKSKKRSNTRMYFVGGVKPAWEASGKEDKGSDIPKPLLGTFNFLLEYGFGIDIYYPLFKFSPEIRFSHGLVNMHVTQDPTELNIYNGSLSKIFAHNVSLYFHFQ